MRTSTWAVLGIGYLLGMPVVAEMLYNGIELPAAWPPADISTSREPMPLPYLEHRPAVVPIDVGRQLFVDDFLIEDTTLKRTLHAAEYPEGNPVLRPDKPWEGAPGPDGMSIFTEDAASKCPTAMPFSDGVWYDPADKVFKLWYMAGYCMGTAYAVSDDGIHWQKPELDVVPGTNLVHTAKRDSGTVWLDLKEPDPARRFKMFLYLKNPTGILTVYFSPDGIHWSEPAATSGPLGDRSTVFFNPFRDQWVYSIRGYTEALGRFRRYSENPDVVKAAVWEKDKAPFWTGADDLDPARADLGTRCELYNLDAVAYESLTIGLFSIWRGQPKDRAKPNEICVGFSRDGFHWQRPTHEAFIPVSERSGDWNWANIQSAGGGCLVVGDKLYFYVSGRKGIPGTTLSGESATGLAVLRRDGFASMDAAEEEGTLTTRPVRFAGKYLFVNVCAPEGELRVEALDADGGVIPEFSREACVPVRGDSTGIAVQWKGGNDLSPLAGRDVRFRFHLRNGQFYAFWVSPEATGASHGYVAAGGPGFGGMTDTVGCVGK